MLTFEAINHHHTTLFWVVVALACVAVFCASFAFQQYVKRRYPRRDV